MVSGFLENGQPGRNKQEKGENAALIRVVLKLFSKSHNYLQGIILMECIL